MNARTARRIAYVRAIGAIRKDIDNGGMYDDPECPDDQAAEKVVEAMQALIRELAERAARAAENAPTRRRR